MPSNKPPPIFVRRKGEILLPSSRFDARQLERYSEGVDLRVVLTQRRSSPQNRLYWAILDKVVEAKGLWANKECLHRALLMHLGFVETWIDLFGLDHVQAKSSAFDKMDGAEFREYFDAVLDLLSTVVVPGMSIDDLLMLGHNELDYWEPKRAASS